MLPLSLRFGEQLMVFDTPKIMGILNLTPDSFHASSRQLPDTAEATAEQMLIDGATFLDIGGYSTRPGATEISQEEELARIMPVISRLAMRFPKAILSVDTFRAEVARQAVEAGAGMINDVSGGNLDEKMFATVADLGVPYVLMHSRGNPKTMQQLTDYEDITLDVVRELRPKVAQLEALGVYDLVIDPGFGFAKNITQNFELLRNFQALNIFEKPILIGISRKSMIWRTLETNPEAALNGTSILNTFALLNGANILRVHDVREAAEAIRLCRELQ